MDTNGLFASILAWADYDEERLLDLLHYTLVLPSDRIRNWQSVDTLLELGGSVWRATGQGLVRRVDPTATQAFNAATSVQDPASEEMQEAWTKAYGKNPDASDAWDHAIKAVEAILRRIVSPDNTQATLGTLIRGVNSAHKFHLVLTNDLGGVATFLAMLQLMWPNPDRGDLQQRHIPSLEEAYAVVQLAVTIMQWARDGQIARR